MYGPEGAGGTAFRPVGEKPWTDLLFCRLRKTGELFAQRADCWGGWFLFSAMSPCNRALVRDAVMCYLLLKLTFDKKLP
jgi:hypothetical protein